MYVRTYIYMCHANLKVLPHSNLRQSVSININYVASCYAHKINNYYMYAFKNVTTVIA